jgi:DNA replication protein DnaC
MCEVIIERHRRSSTIFTSNRDIDEWQPLFADPVLAQSALDRLAHNAHQIEMEGETYRARRSPNTRYKTYHQGETRKAEQ